MIALLAAAPIEDDEATPEATAALNRVSASLASGEGIPHDEVLREPISLIAKEINAKSRGEESTNLLRG